PAGSRAFYRTGPRYPLLGCAIAGPRVDGPRRGSSPDRLVSRVPGLRRRNRPAPRAVGGREPGRRVAGSLRRRAGGAGRSGDGTPGARQPAHRPPAPGDRDRPVLYRRRVHAHLGSVPVHRPGRPAGPRLLCSAPRRDGADRGGDALLRPVRPPGRGTRRRGYPDQAPGLYRPRPLLAGPLNRTARCSNDALKPDIQCVRTHWIRGFMAFPVGSPGEVVRRELATGPPPGMISATRPMSSTSI